MGLNHGGQRAAAAYRYGIPVDRWLDVSTGIAPWSWPVPDVPAQVWARLPESTRALCDAAGACYGCAGERLLAVPGSQFAIRHIPATLAPARVAIPVPGYAEHGRGWAEAGHRVYGYRDRHALQALVGRVEHAVVINPNNPTAETVSSSALHAFLRTLPGLLVVDEAFMDTGAHSLLPMLPERGAVVLRSLGKFFGLAGLRLGFVAGDVAVRRALAARLEPWGVSHPAVWIGSRALADMVWQTRQRQRVLAAGQALADLLERHLGAARVAQAGLFATARFDDPQAAPAWFDRLARHGVLTRLGDDGHWLRLGLPGPGFQRLAGVFAALASA
ncbi:threonine-phosphate decarboxylase CobD [Salinisphaera sp. T31B1]|uniref:threonine-phosphate decarboxylase CobD n=1 Tax=Salinisphaera sp. T31B1 TaxID=727963 RepID=UPI003340882A